MTVSPFPSLPVQYTVLQLPANCHLPFRVARAILRMIGLPLMMMREEESDVNIAEGWEKRKNKVEVNNHFACGAKEDSFVTKLPGFTRSSCS